MTLESTIRRSLRYYPSLFENRTQVLHFLFLVIGNGYYWHKGQLVKPAGADSSKRRLSEVKVRQRARKTEIIASEDFDFYCFRAGKIAEIPADIQPDWARGVHEFASQMLRKDAPAWAKRLGKITLRKIQGRLK